MFLIQSPGLRCQLFCLTCTHCTSNLTPVWCLPSSPPTRLHSPSAEVNSKCDSRESASMLPLVWSQSLIGHNNSQRRTGSACSSPALLLNLWHSHHQLPEAYSVSLPLNLSTHRPFRPNSPLHYFLAHSNLFSSSPFKFLTSSQRPFWFPYQSIPFQYLFPYAFGSLTSCCLL